MRTERLAKLGHRASRKDRGRSMRKWRPGVVDWGTVEALEARALLSTLFVDAASASATPDGSADNPFKHIQDAVNAATAGDTVSVAPGRYVEWVVVDRALSLVGPNAGVNPNTGARGPEASIVPPVDSPGGGVSVLVAASGVTIDGFTLDGRNDDLGGGEVLNGVVSHARSGVANVSSAGVSYRVDTMVVQNNVISNYTGFGVLSDAWDFEPPVYVSTGNVVRDNRIDNMPTVDANYIGTLVQGRGISIEHNGYAEVTGNVITRTATGIQVIYAFDPDPAGTGVLIANNDVQSYDRGILVYTADIGSWAEDPAVFDRETFLGRIEDNRIGPDPTSGTIARSAGIAIERLLGATGLAISGNDVSGYGVGLLVGASTTSRGLTVSGGSLSGNGVGVRLTNAGFPGDMPDRPVSLTLEGVAVSGSTSTGLDVVDARGGVTATATLTVGAGTTVSGGPHGATLSGPGARLVETTAAALSFSQTPAATTADTTAGFTFATSGTVSTPNDLVYNYRLDGAAAQPGASPLSLSGLSKGVHTLVVDVTTQAGQTATATYTWTVTTASPSVPVVAASSDTGFSSTDGITTDRTPTLQGTAVPGTTVRLYDGADLLGTVQANASGAWVFTVGSTGSTSIKKLSEGSHSITATATDSGGWVSLPSAAAIVIVDRTAPQVSLDVTVPAGSSGGNVPVSFQGLVTDQNALDPNATYRVRNWLGLTVGTGVVQVASNGQYGGTVQLDAPGFLGSFLSFMRTYRLTVTVRDAAGNVASSTAVFQLPPAFGLGAWFAAPPPATPPAIVYHGQPDADPIWMAIFDQDDRPGRSTWPGS